MVALLALAVVCGVGLGADASDRVRQEIAAALQAEALGDDSGREAALRRALEIEPGQARARGLLGQVKVNGRWVEARRAEQDASEAAALAEYNARRAAAPDNVAGHWDLANWCERRGLKAEARAHFTAVTRLKPEHPAAWERLGLVQADGRWVEPEALAAERAEARVQAEADRRWAPRLALWERSLRDERRPGAERALRAVRDPRAVPSVERVLVTGDTLAQAWAVIVLGQIDAPAASRDLAQLAVRAPDERIRDRARRALARRDARAFVGLLINRLRPPAELRETVPVGDDGSPGLVVVQDAATTRLRTYQPPLLSMPPAQIGSRWINDSAAGPLLVFRSTENNTTRPRVRTDEAIPVAAIAAEDRRSIAAMQRQQDEDVEAIRSKGAETAQEDRRIVQVLWTVTGQDFGTDRTAWAQWWTDQLGYTYVSPPPPPRQVVTTSAAPTYIPQPPPVIVFNTVLRSCFAAGTPVQTRTGLQPIEDLRVGDMVLAQDTRTGALAFRPIVAVHHNPPAETWRIGLDDTNIVATGIHRFWKAGQGWAMARDLRPGDVLRTVGGTATVRTVQRGAVVPVFNLDVDRDASFFVGRPGLLVHDNTLVPPTPEPFDATNSTGE